MFETSFPMLAVWASALLLISAALIHLAGIRGLGRLYAGWDMPVGFYFTIAMAELAAAYLLLTPEFRLWGILIAGVIAFGSVVLLLDQGQYLYAIPVIVFMVGLFPAALSIPVSHEHIRYAAETVALLRLG